MANQSDVGDLSNLGMSAKGSFLAHARHAPEEGVDMSDPRIQAWLLGQDPISDEVLELLGERWSYLREREDNYLEQGGVIFPAVPIFVVESIEQWEDSYEVGIFASAEMAHQCAESYNESERQEHGEHHARHAYVKIEPLWLPRDGSSLFTESLLGLQKKQ